MTAVPDDLITVAVLANETEANIIKNQLEAAGIKAYLSGEEAVAMAWHMTGAYGGIKLQVASSDAEDARILLEPKPWQDEPLEKSALATSETLEKMREDEEEVLSEREKIANKAGLAAVFGLLFWPLEAYAFWLLLKVYFAEEKLEGRPRLYAKLGAGICVPFLLCSCLAVVMFIRGPVERKIDLRDLPHPQTLVGSWEGKSSGEKGDTRLEMQLRDDGTILYRSSGATETECTGTWAYKNQTFLVCYDHYLKGDSTSKGILMKYDLEDFKKTEMVWVTNRGNVRMVRIK